ncbi:hypothetical protein [uncultured Alistipes sp.]|uniref:hypothetical protein n=1 Tax=uncultured Alistipes sp. TaxID=538949 RepID=UPI00262677FE|nr:hypothetical protein [uncultured Alistipes sp.]
MRIRIVPLIAFAALLFVCLPSWGRASQDVLQAGHPVSEDSTKRKKPRRGRLSRLIINSISTNPIDRKALEEAARRDNDYFGRFAGRTIGSVSVERGNVFDNDTRTWIERRVNAVHRITREQQIRRDLLFGPGDKLDPQLMINNRRLLRSRDYISDAAITVVPSAEDSTVVDVIVATRDKWTISADVGFEGDGDMFLQLYDDNLLGWGNRLGISTYFNWKNGHYGGNVFEYKTPNIFGSFFEGRLIAGKGFDRSDFGAEALKKFIRRTDYAAGASFYYRKEPIDIYPLDSTFQTASRNWDFWAGRSRFIPSLGSSLFFTGRFHAVRYTARPEVSDTLNPYFHNERFVLFGLGLYREKFRTSNLIYGYGVNEDIAYGYRFSLTGGYSRGEFGDRWYMGGDFSAGYFTGFGYLRWSVALGSYLNRGDRRFYRTVLESNVNYFSNLLGNGRYKVRQFIDLNVTRGWNRLDGFRESIGFFEHAELRGLDESVYGTNRAVLRSETVVFTPWDIYRFKMAMYGFADVGTIGYRGNLFRNRFYSTLGVGVRIKNENLIFGTINIRLGIALGKTGFMRTEYFDISSENRREPLRYIPQEPSVVAYE